MSSVSEPETGDVVSSVSEPETGDIASQTDDISDLNRRHDSAATPQETAVSSDESTKNPPESARAREAGGDDPEGPPPACAVWRDNRAKLEALDCWPLLERAIPTEDDGEVLTLAVEVPAVGYAILAWAAKEAERVLVYSGNPRLIACQVRRWVQPALVQRGVGGGAADASAHRRDGELVTLQDAAWQVWASKASELEAHDCQVAVAECIPDDIDAGVLVLFVGSTVVSRRARRALAPLPRVGARGAAMRPRRPGRLLSTGRRRPVGRPRTEHLTPVYKKMYRIPHL